MVVTKTHRVKDSDDECKDNELMLRIDVNTPSFMENDGVKVNANEVFTNDYIDSVMVKLLQY